MFEKLKEVRRRLEEIDRSLSHPEAGSDPSSLGRLMKERSRLEPVVTAYSRIQKTRETIQDLEELLREETDPEMASYLKEELRASRQEEEELSGKLQLLLLPRDENDGKNVVLEIRAGVGGDEAALFAADLCRMYLRYSERKGWKAEVTSVNENGLGGFKECILLVSGEDAWSHLKYESGTHRVQRVPETESAGRIHTSAATVAVMPEADQIRRVPCTWQWRTVCQHDGFRGPARTYPDRDCHIVPG